jgi:hypothetical protein
MQTIKVLFPFETLRTKSPRYLKLYDSISTLILQSSVPVWTVILQTVFLAKRFHYLIYASLIPTVGGVMLASWTESEFDATGFWAALIASVITAAITVVSGILLVVKLDSLNLLYLMAPMAFIMLMPVAIFSGEAKTMFVEWYPGSTMVDWSILLISGIIAFLLSTLYYPLYSKQ